MIIYLNLGFRKTLQKNIRFPNGKPALTDAALIHYF